MKCPTPLPEEARTPQLEALLAVKPYEVPAKEKKEPKRKTEGLRIRDASDARSILGLLQRQVGECAHNLDGCDTRAAGHLLDDHVELRLLDRCLLGRRRGGSRDRGSGSEGGGRDAKTFLEMVDKVASLLKGEPGNGVAELKDLRGLSGGGGDGDGAAAAVGDGEGPGGRGGVGW